MLKRLMQLLTLLLINCTLIITSVQAATMDIKMGVLTVTGAAFNGSESYTTTDNFVRWNSSGRGQYSSLTSNYQHTSCGRYHVWYASGYVYWCYVSNHTTELNTVAHINNYSIKLQGIGYGITNSATGSYRYATVTGSGRAYCGCCNSCNYNSYEYCNSYKEDAGSGTYRYTPWTSPTSTVLKNCMTTNQNASFGGAEVIIDGGTYSGSEFIPEFVHYNNLSFFIKDVI